MSDSHVRIGSCRMENDEFEFNRDRSSDRSASAICGFDASACDIFRFEVIRSGQLSRRQQDASYHHNDPHQEDCTARREEPGRRGVRPYTSLARSNPMAKKAKKKGAKKKAAKKKKQ